MDYWAFGLLDSPICWLHRERPPKAARDIRLKGNGPTCPFGRFFFPYTERVGAHRFKPPVKFQNGNAIHGTFGGSIDFNLR